MWDGRRWIEDVTGEVHRRAKETVRSIYKEAYTADDESRRMKLSNHANNSESQGRLNAMINVARSAEETAILPENLDRDPWLFNVLNGTVDLKTGDLIDHNREDLITRLASVRYDCFADCPVFLGFLERIFNKDPEIMRFVQKAVGYALTGSTREQCLFFLYGLGANGKSTLLETLKALMGDYGHQASSEALIAKKSRNQIPNDIAAMRGGRLVTAMEVDQGRLLAEATVKQLTGGDEVAARFLYKEWFTFKPEFKIFLAANHKPGIRGTDHAIWRRIHLIPFDVQIPDDEQDKELLKNLKAELPGILNWALEGCLLWQEEGLRPPKEVQKATCEYREEMDPLSDFFEERCIFGRGAWVMSKDIYEAYKTWAVACEEVPISQTKFAKRLKERGLLNKVKTTIPNKGKIQWVGIALKSE